MKKFFAVALMMAVLAFGSQASAKSTLTEGGSVEVTTTSNIVNDVDSINYNTVEMSENGTVVSFTLDSPSKVRFALSTGTCKMEDYRDEFGELLDTSIYLYLFSDNSMLRQLGDSMKVYTGDRGCIFNDIYYLEAGTYYLQIGDLDSDVLSFTGNVKLGVIAQELTSGNKKSGVSKDDAVEIKFNKEYKDCTTMKNPNDWYVLDLANDSYIRMYYSAEVEGYITIYNSDGVELDSTSRSEEGEVRTEDLFLKSGRYYFVFTSKEGAGNTTLKLTSTGYYLNLEESMEKGIDYIKIKSIDFSKIDEFKVVKTKVPTADSELWDTKGEDLKKTTKKYRPMRNGWYSFRIKDIDGNILFRTIKVKNVDTEKPSRVKVKYSKGNLIEGTAEAYAKVYVKIGGKTYRKSASGDSSFGIVMKKKYKKGTKFTIYAVDRSGNVGVKIVRRMK